MEEKRSKGQEGKVEEDAAQAEHFQVWDRFWGRPGYGAPRQSGQNKENLMKMLHYPKQVTQSPSRYCHYPFIYCNFSTLFHAPS